MPLISARPELRQTAAETELLRSCRALQPRSDSVFGKNDLSSCRNAPACALDDNRNPAVLVFGARSTAQLCQRKCRTHPLQPDNSAGDLRWRSARQCTRAERAGSSGGQRYNFCSVHALRADRQQCTRRQTVTNKNTRLHPLCCRQQRTGWSLDSVGVLNG